jgi:hypothetical protein
LRRIKKYFQGCTNTKNGRIEALKGANALAKMGTTIFKKVFGKHFAEKEVKEKNERM